MSKPIFTLPVALLLAASMSFLSIAGVTLLGAHEEAASREVVSAPSCEASCDAPSCECAPQVRTLASLQD